MRTCSFSVQMKEMKQLNKLQTVIMSVGALLMIVGVFGIMLGIGETFATTRMGVAATLCYVTGTGLFTIIQIMQVYYGNNIVIRRLRRILLIGNVSLILSAFLMFEQTFRIVYPLMATNIDGYNAYCHYVSNNWGVLLLIGCILLMYSTLRMAQEIKKEA